MCSNSKKVKLFIDADDTILRSSEAVIKLLNQKYGTNKTTDDWDDWGYLSISEGKATRQDISDLFESQEFFDIVEVYDGFEKMLDMFSDKVAVRITTKGTPQNLLCKEHFFESRYMDEDLEVVGLDFTEHAKHMFDKSAVDMRGGICIDDRIDCLKSCNANVKILLTNGKYKRWSRPEDAANIENLYIAKDWDEVISIINFAMKNRFFMETLDQ